MQTFRVGFLALLSTFVGSCSEHDDGAPPVFSSGVASSAPVSELGTQDKTQLCQSYGAYVSTSVGFDLVAEAVCLPQAILLGGSPEGCQKRLDACTADVPPPVQLNAQLNDVQVCSQNLAQCQLSVSQLEGCINLRLDWAYALVRSLSCAGANNADTRAMADAMREVSVCAAGHAGCDQFIGVDPEPVLN